MKKYFWCLFKSGLYPEKKIMNQLIYKCIWILDNCPNVKVHIDYYEIWIITSSSVIKLWNANKFYSWLSRGSINGREYKNIMASKSAMYDFKECLKKHGYEINIPLPPPVIKIDDIKC